jgi:NADH dehydrogenase
MINIPVSDKKRIVIVGCGFGGLRLGKKLRKSGYQVVILDKYNYHQFQPLFYQVATAGLEASSISFPLRKIFQHYKDYHIRLAEVQHIDTGKQHLWTTLGIVKYDYLVLAQGAGNSFFGMKNMETLSKPMKSVPESITLRNTILQNFEDALAVSSGEERKVYENLVVVGGGPTGVEISGALAEMKKYVIPKDFPELDKKKIHIHLIEATDRLLPSLSVKSSLKSREFLEKLGVNVYLNSMVMEYDGKKIYTTSREPIPTNLVIWTAGIRTNHIDGLPEKCTGKNGRYITDRYNRVAGFENIFVLGDAALMVEEKFPGGHPQVAPVAIQHADNIALNFRKMILGQPLYPFSYKDKGTMATIGRNRAVVDLPYAHFQGTFAWFVWMFVHLMSIVGAKNRILIFLNWFWNYVTYDQSLRLILRPKGC